MDINQYTVFLEVAKQESISRAAEKLGYTQSGVSHTIRRLEDDMNLVLFQRNRNGAYLTPVGREIYPLILQLVQCHENLHQTVLGLHNLMEGTLNIGTYSSISRQWLPHIIKSFKADYPKIMIRFREGGNKDILRWVENREVDLGFLSASDSIRKSKQVDWIPLMDDPLLALLPPDFLPENQYRIPIKSFNKKTFIISEHGTDIDIHRTLKSNKVSPDIQYSATDDYTIISMVACGLGVSILPKLVLDGQNNPGIHTLPLEPAAARSLGIVLPSKDLASPATKKFIEYTEKYIRSL